MESGYILKGFGVGFSIAAPVGPIGVLCIRRSLADGARVGLATGLGAATADAFYGSVAAFGLTALSGFLVREQFGLGLIGGLFLLYLGARTFFGRPAEGGAADGKGGLPGAYASTLLLTLTNPMTVLSFVAIFAGFGLGRAPNYGAALLVVLGVFSGSACWWLILSQGIGYFRSHLGSGWTRSVNRLSGAILLAFGVAALAHSFRR
ncbi:MAG TPA: LysE family transporter [Opitutaceae bacterium]|jgi:threonine/homoserine/homoserine lactone efflux protein|nr:LysE family transporter [Opitutaceae bacterium]